MFSRVESEEGTALRELLRVSAPFTLLSFLSIEIILPSHLARLGATPLILGEVYSLRTGARLLARAASGVLSTRLSFKRLLLLSFLLRGASYWALYAGERLEACVVGLVMLSTSMGLESPAYLSLIALAGGKVAASFGVALSIRMAPAILAPIVTGVIAQSAGPRYIFAAAALLSLLSLALVAKLQAHQPTGGGDGGYRRLMTREFILLMGSACLLFICVSSFRPFFYWWATEVLCYDYATLGVIASLGEVLAFFSRIYTGLIAERIGYGLAYALVGVLRSSSLLLLASANSLALITLSYLAVRGLVAAPSRNALISRLASRDMYGLAYALVGLAIDLGSATGPLLTGLVIEEWGPRAGFTLLAALYALFTLVALQLRAVSGPSSAEPR